MSLDLRRCRIYSDFNLLGDIFFVSFLPYLGKTEALKPEYFGSRLFWSVQAIWMF